MPGGTGPQCAFAAAHRHLRKVTGGGFTAKDFRTWQAAVVAATTRKVAEHLGNTPVIARKSYIDPRVVARFFDGEIIAVAGFSASETAVRMMLSP